MIQAVIFDLDGVLVSTDELHYRAWRKLAEEESIPFDRRVNQRLRGVSRMQSLEILLAASPRDRSAQDKLALADRKNSYFLELLRTLTPADVLPGGHELIAELRRRGLGIAIGSCSRNALETLERIGLTGVFDAVVDGNDVTKSKPDPEVFLLAAARLNVAPGQCLVVEDAQAGIEAARRAGMAVFGIGPPGTFPGLRHAAPSLADVTVERLLTAAEGVDDLSHIASTNSSMVR